MNKTIYKYQLLVDDIQEISIPKESQILSLQTQNEIPCLWILVNKDNLNEKRKFRTYGTGHKVDTFPGDYIGTYQLKNELLCFHVFEV